VGNAHALAPVTKQAPKLSHANASNEKFAAPRALRTGTDNTDWEEF
jgi:hypothetical protein